MRRAAHYFYQFGPFRIDPAKRLLLQEGEVVPLSPKAFELLVTLAENSPRVLEKDELMAELWPGSVVEESNLTQTIYLLRKALGEGTHESHYIETIPRHGYRFVAAVEEISEEREAADQNTKNIIAEPRDEEKTNGVKSDLPAPDLSHSLILSRPWWMRRQVLAVGLALLGLMLLGVWLWSAQKAVTLKTGAPVRSIAVLPFKPVNPDGSDNYLGLGLADVLITRLSSLQQVVVQPISVVRRYDNLEQPPVTAGRELQVEAVLEGSFQKIDNRLRVTARLINVEDGHAVWSGQFDEQFTDIFKVQDSISEQVASALALRLTPEKRLLLTRHGINNAEAYQLYLKGRYHWNKRTAADLKKAIAYFEQAKAISPDAAPVYVGLADCYNLLSFYDASPPQESFPKAKAAALRALELDETLAEAHTSLGWIRWVYEWDWPAAERAFQRAIALNPNYVTAHHWYGWCLVQRGQFDEGLARMKRAAELESLSLIIQTQLGASYFYMGQTDQAIEQYRKVLDLDANFVRAHFYLGQAYEQKGLYAEAIAEMKKALALSTESVEYQAGLGHAYASSGDLRQAQQILDQLIKETKQHYISRYSIALLYTGLSQKDQAFAWLNQGARERASRLTRLKVDPRFAPLRPDPRFAELLQHVGLPRS